ncbi:MAG TPA: hypothetical protein V6D33_01800 [Cyanophyceae cyanobacterium]
MTDEQLQEMRSRIAELEERDADFARKSNGSRIRFADYRHADCDLFL